MQKLAQYIEPGCREPRATATATSRSRNGEAAMYLQGPWAFGEIAKSGPDLELGTFPLPMTDDPDDLQGAGQHRPRRVDPRGVRRTRRRPARS